MYRPQTDERTGGKGTLLAFHRPDAQDAGNDETIGHNSQEEVDHTKINIGNDDHDCHDCHDCHAVEGGWAAGQS